MTIYSPAQMRELSDCSPCHKVPWKACKTSLPPCIYEKSKLALRPFHPLCTPSGMRERCGRGGSQERLRARTQIVLFCSAVLSRLETMIQLAVRIC